MNDEISEILIFIENKIYPKDSLLFEKWSFLKDYITNLQQENLALARENEKEKQFIKDCGFQNQQQLALMYLDYKSRVEKAVELIHDKLDRFDCDGSMAVSMSISYFEEDLLNILQNGSEK